MADDSGVAGYTARKMQAAGYQAEIIALPETLYSKTEGLQNSGAERLPVLSDDEAVVERVFSQALNNTCLPLTGFIYIASENEDFDGELFSQNGIDRLKIIFFCAKYFFRVFKPETGYGFFVSAARMDGRLGLGAGGNFMQGGLFGLHKSIGIEWNGMILSKAVDLAPELPPEKAADYLIDEIFNTGYKHPEVGRSSDGRRFVPGLTESYLVPNLHDKGPEPGDVLLITGGGRGITAQCAIRLAKIYRCGFILLGRTDLSADIEWTGGERDRVKLKKLAIARSSRTALKLPEIEKLVDSALHQMEIMDTLDAIQSAGGRARYVSCDARDLKRLRDTVKACESELGPVTGLVHGAGNIADKKIQRKTSADFENVFGSKIGGLDACLSCLGAGRLKYLLLFSSIAGYFGNAGQSDYAMANEVMNKFAFAFKRRRPDCKTISINWGLWDGGSMVSDSIRNAVKGSDIHLIPVETGTGYFADQFAYKQEPGVCQIIINPCDRLIRPDLPI